MEHGAGSTEHGAWSMEHGARSRGHGAWSPGSDPPAGGERTDSVEGALIKDP